MAAHLAHCPSPPGSPSSPLSRASGGAREQAAPPADRSASGTDCGCGPDAGAVRPQRSAGSRPAVPRRAQHPPPAAAALAGADAAAADDARLRPHAVGGGRAGPHRGAAAVVDRDRRDHRRQRRVRLRAGVPRQRHGRASRATAARPGNRHPQRGPARGARGRPRRGGRGAAGGRGSHLRRRGAQRRRRPGRGRVPAHRGERPG